MDIKDDSIDRLIIGWSEQMGEVAAEVIGNAVKKMSEQACEDRGMPQTRPLAMVIDKTYGCAYRLYAEQKYVEALRLFNLLVLFDPCYKHIFGLAACQHQLKDYKQAITTYRFAGLADPQDPITHYHLSDCFVHLEQPACAIGELEKVILKTGDDAKYESIKARAANALVSLKLKIKDDDPISGLNWLG